MPAGVSSKPWITLVSDASRFPLACCGKGGLMAQSSFKHPAKRFEAQDVRLSPKDIFGRLKGPETIMMKATDLIGIIVGMRLQAREIERYSQRKD